MSQRDCVLTPSGLRPKSASVLSVQGILSRGRHPATPRSLPANASPGKKKKNFTCFKIPLESRQLESYQFCDHPTPAPQEERNLSRTHLSQPCIGGGNTHSRPPALNACRFAMAGKSFTFWELAPRLWCLQKGSSFCKDAQASIAPGSEHQPRNPTYLFAPPPLAGYQSRPPGTS